jgi:glycosyltransferase involved in cell wall biosynthesis
MSIYIRDEHVNEMDVKPPSRVRVLLLAYSISPVRGSEYSVGWNYVTEMSKYCDLTVIYGLAGPHMGDLEEIEQYIKENGEIPNVQFIGIKPSFLARLLNSPNRRGFWVYSFYMAYTAWHRQAARKAKLLLANEEFSVVHYLCPIGYREPGFFWQFDMPYVWGPIGGMVPTRHLKGSPRSYTSIGKTKLKNLANSIQLRLSRRVAKALARANVLVAATSENAELIKIRFGRDAQVIPENAIPSQWVSLQGVTTHAKLKLPVKLIWVGSLDARKSPDLLIDALAMTSPKEWILDIVGDGPLRQLVQTRIVAAGLSDRVNLRGLMARSAVLDLMSKSDIHVITSMNEGNPTVIWEALALGVPTLSLAHCGMRDTLCESCGVLVPISDYQQTAEAIAVELDKLITDPEALAIKKAGAMTCMQKHLWEQRAETWLQKYNESIESHKSKTLSEC